MIRFSDVKNVNISKNPLTPAKLKTKKQDKTSMLWPSQNFILYKCTALI